MCEVGKFASEKSDVVSSTFDREGALGDCARAIPHSFRRRDDDTLSTSDSGTESIDRTTISLPPPVPIRLFSPDPDSLAPDFKRLELGSHGPDKKGKMFLKLCKEQVEAEFGAKFKEVSICSGL